MNQLSKTFACLLIFLGFSILSPWQTFPGKTYLEPLQGWRILIDPGTGRNTVKLPFLEKAEGPGGLSEPDVNMNVALFLKEFLQKAGAEIELARKPGLPLPSFEDRLKTAQKFRANLILSIHHDYGKDPKANYVKAYYYPANKEPDTSIARHMAAALEQELRVKSRGAEVFAFPLIAETDIPSVIVVCGCITNPAYEKKLKDLEYNRQEAIALLKGMMNFQTELSKSQSPKPPLDMERKIPPAPPAIPSQTFSAEPLPPPSLPPAQTPAMALPFTKPPMPLPKSLPTQVNTAHPSAPFLPVLLNPTNTHFDQSWLFGEAWGKLATRKGVSFIAPEGSPVRAAADGIVFEASATPPAAAPHYPNCVILKHYNIIPEVPTFFTVYGKLAGMNVKKGDRVKRGDIIGTCGAPSKSIDTSRETELSFEVRWGNVNENCIVNPELFTEHVSKNTGIIIGKLLDRDGNHIPSIRVIGAVKPLDIRRYNFSITYSGNIRSSEVYQENFVIGDVSPGEYTLSCDYGIYKVLVEPGKITFVTWQID